MKQASLAPPLVGIVMLVILSGLFYQTKKVDRINQQHAQVLELLEHTKQLDHDLRQEVTLAYYDQYPNFDLLLDKLFGLEAALEGLSDRSLHSLRQSSNGTDFYLSQLDSLRAERSALVRGYMRHMVLLKNAVAGLSESQALHPLMAIEPEAYHVLNQFRHVLLAYATNPTTELTDQADEMLDEVEDLLYDLEEQSLSPELMELVSYSHQHGRIVYHSRAQVERLLDQLFQQATPQILDQLVNDYLSYHEKQEQLASYHRTGLYLVGSLLLAFMVLLAMRLRRTASNLKHEKELMEVTLGSVGDAVLTTDPHGRISYSNNQAEQLTGISVEQAMGLPLEQVLPLYSELTDKPIDNLAVRCLDQGKILTINQHTYMQRSDGQRSRVTLTASPMIGPDQFYQGAVLAVQDVGEAQTLAEQLDYESNHDSLTGLLNRLAFVQKVQQQLGRKPDGDRGAVLWHIDLDHFSLINDICGSKGGDGFLRTLAGELKRALGDEDVLARIGGDEFAILRPNAAPSDALDLACELRERINQIEFEWEDNHFDSTATIGVVFLNQDYLDISDVFMAAKAAVETAREQGRNNIYVHTKDVYEQSRKHELSQWVPKIRKALDQDRYRLYLQSISPISEQGCHQPHHAEVLLRMEDEGGRVIPPIFIPAAEEYDLMPQLDRWVISEVCRRIAEAHEQDLPGKELSYSVNLSGTTLSDSFFIDYIRTLFEELNTPTAQICFEITETAAILNLEAAVEFIDSVRSLGCRFALDDFGSGMSSFAYLQNLKVDYLKIDGAFVKKLAQDRVQYSIVEAINAVGQTLEMQTIAEFVEDDEIIRGLSKIGVDFAQGYGIDQPRPWDIYHQDVDKSRLLDAAE